MVFCFIFFLVCLYLPLEMEFLFFPCFYLPLEMEFLLFISNRSFFLIFSLNYFVCIFL